MLTAASNPEINPRRPQWSWTLAALAAADLSRARSYGARYAEAHHLEAPRLQAPAELGADGIGGGRDQVAHLVQCLGPTLAGRGPGHTQNPHGFDVSVPRLGFTASLTGQSSSGGRDGVLGIGLALASPTLAIGAIDFDDADAFTLEETGQPGSIRARPFDPHQLDRSEVAQPAQ